MIVGNKTGYCELKPGFVFTDLPGQFLGKQNIPTVPLEVWGHKGRSLLRVGYLIPWHQKAGLEQRYKANQVKKLTKEHTEAFKRIQEVKAELSLKVTAHRKERLASAIQYEQIVFTKFKEALDAKELLSI